MSNHFYLTLPSNSSMQIFPDNKISQFKTQLSKRITLQGDWEVGLVEIHYPRSFYTITSKDFYTGIEYALPPTPGATSIKEVVEESAWKFLNFPGGKFETVKGLVDTLNSNKDLSKFANIFVNDKSRAQVQAKGNNVVRLKFSDSLRRILNFDEPEVFSGDTEATKKVDIDANFPTQMYIYCDIVEPQHVGDVVAPLLRIVNIENNGNLKDGSQVVNIFTHPHYTPVLRREFQQLEIDIRDDLGESIPFMSGSLNVKLHFRKVS